MTSGPAPKRGEIWAANLGDPPRRHWVVVVSLDSRNASERVDSVLIAPFGSYGIEGPTVLKFEPGESGLPQTSYLKGHFISTLPKSRLVERLPRPLSSARLRDLCLAIRRAFDPDTPWPEKR